MVLFFACCLLQFILRETTYKLCPKEVILWHLIVAQHISLKGYDGPVFALLSTDFLEMDAYKHSAAIDGDLTADLWT